MKLIGKLAIPIVILVVGFGVMVGFLSLRKQTPKRAPEIRSKIVKTEIVKLGAIPARITAYGRVASAQPVQLYAEVSGKLEQGRIPFKPAQSFSRGDLLLKIDDRQARLNLNSAKSDLMTALAAVIPEIEVDFPGESQVWQDYFNACRFDSRIAPLPETENARIKLFLSRFGVYKRYFAVRDLEILLDKHSLNSPFDGAIVSADLRVGSTARVGSLLGTIINLEQMEVPVPVDLKDVPWIDQQQPVVFTSSEIAGRWTGKVVRVGSHIDTRTQTVDVYMAVDDAQTASLLNGVFLQADIPGRDLENAFAVPPKALYEDRYVYLIVNGQLQTRDVKILRRETDRVLVDGGIETGDTLVTEIMQGVAPGMPARSRTSMTEVRGQ